jgi:hypothetical protein
LREITAELGGFFFEKELRLVYLSKLPYPFTRLRTQFSFGSKRKTGFEHSFDFKKIKTDHRVMVCFYLAVDKLFWYFAPKRRAADFL